MFITELASNPLLLVVTLLNIGVIIVNGATDAPNAIAGAVVTGALSFRRGVLLAAVCNFFGVLFVTSVNASVAETIYTIADFGPDTGDALTALCDADGLASDKPKLDAGDFVTRRGEDKPGQAAAPAPAGKAEAASSSEPEPEPAESLEELLAAAGGSPGVLRCEILAG